MAFVPVTLPQFTASVPSPGFDYFKPGRSGQDGQSPLYHPLQQIPRPTACPPGAPGCGVIVPVGLDPEVKDKPKRQNAWGSKSKPPTVKPSTYDERDYIRPCNHNTWEKEGKKRGRLVLRCVQEDCRALWKTHPECHEKCPDFFAGQCTKGGACPHPHIYANLRRRIANKPSADARVDAIKRNSPVADDETGPAEDVTETVPTQEQAVLSNRQEFNDSCEGPLQGHSTPGAEVCTEATPEDSLPWRRDEVKPMWEASMYPPHQLEPLTPQAPQQLGTGASFYSPLGSSLAPTSPQMTYEARNYNLGFQDISRPQQAQEYRHDPGYGTSSSDNNMFVGQHHNYSDTQQEPQWSNHFIPTQCHQFQEPIAESARAVVDGITVPGPQGSVMVFSNGKWQWVFAQAGAAQPDDVVANGTEPMRYTPNQALRARQLAQTPPVDATQQSEDNPVDSPAIPESKAPTNKEPFVSDKERQTWLEEPNSFLHRGRVRTA